MIVARVAQTSSRATVETGEVDRPGDATRACLARSIPQDRRARPAGAAGRTIGRDLPRPSRSRSVAGS